jgi:hypothetical protein
VPSGPTYGAAFSRSDPTWRSASRLVRHAVRWLAIFRAVAHEVRRKQNRPRCATSAAAALMCRRASSGRLRQHLAARASASTARRSSPCRPRPAR